MNFLSNSFDLKTVYLFLSKCNSYVCGFLYKRNAFENVHGLVFYTSPMTIIFSSDWF